MRGFMGGAVTIVAAVAALVGSAAAQETAAVVRTYQGDSYRLAEPSLEVFYTIGEPKEKKAEATAPPTISLTTQPPSAEAGAEKEEKLLRGHSRLTEFTVAKDGVETRIAWDRIRALVITRQPVPASGLPPYVSHYRYSASVTLTDGQRVDADYVNLGTTLLRGQTPKGRVEIPWEEVEHIIFDR